MTAYPNPRPNLAARAAQWSAGRWKTATGAWLAVVIVAALLGAIAGTVKLTDAEQGTGETARGEQILAHAGFKTPASESVLVQSRTLTAGDPRFRAAVADVTGALHGQRQTEDVRSPYAAGATGQISADRHSALVLFDMRGEASSADKRVEPVLRSVGAVQRAHPGLTVAEFGEASAAHALNDTIGKDFSSAERLSVPITFAILLIAFGAFVAAGVPVLLAFSGVLGSIGLSALLSHVFHASDSTSSVILLMGMAVGVDYSLFYLKREREERARGASPETALARAAAGSGQAVLISGGTVLIAMAGMLFAGSKIFTSIGIGAMIVVFLAMVGSLTVLPALLGKLGDRVDRGLVAVLAAGALAVLRPLRWRPQFLQRLVERRTWLQRAKGQGGESRIWGFVLRPALRFPALAALGSAAVLVVLGLPALGMHTKLSGFSDLPKDLAIVKTYDRIQAAFPGANAPAQVVIKAPDVDAPPVRSAIAQLRRESLATGLMQNPVQTFVNPSRTVARVAIPLAGDGEDARSVHALGVLRNRIIPASVGGLPGVETAVTGETAGTHDFNQSNKSHAPLVFAFVLGLAFLLMLVMFRSLVIAATAIVLNLLSVGAAYGVLVWIFQDGHLQGPLGFHSTGAIVTWLPLFLFAVLFGLSMDYHVFIVSRIKELREQGVPTREAVARGIRGTASTVTSAAAVMVAVFAIFASLSTIDIKQMGVGLAVAVLLDATLIRGVLLPATMTLLGERNWYLPRWLAWLPRLHGSSHGASPGYRGGDPAPALD
ncbi:MAG TPA: MMPL family transporter [Solirubrobacteraceae bacterium]|nr:MMPL family transporter [Solirubrobacteraceae bacterium]